MASAFTLVELLVVIGIIALLIGILMPALSAARRQAELTQCLAVQREIASAAAIHVANHSGYYPAAGELEVPNSGMVRGATPESLGDANRVRYSYLHVHEGSMDGTTLAPWQAAVSQYMGKRTSLDGGSNVDLGDQEVGLRQYLKFFLCPSHNYIAGDVPESLIYYAGNLGWMVQQSYVLNEAAFGINDSLGRLRGKASRVRRPAVTVMLADGLAGKPRDNPIRPNMGWVTFINHTATPPITLADALEGNAKAGDPESFDLVRHRGKLNAVFFDGHAETFRITPAALRSAYLLAE